MTALFHTSLQMKNALLLSTGLLVIVGLILGGMTWYGFHKERASLLATGHPTHLNTPPLTPPAPSPLLGVYEWQKYQKARQTALQTNPILQEEYKQIFRTMQSQQADFNAAMVKADPEAASAVAKFEALRAHDGGPMTHANASGQNLKEPPSNLTPQDWVKLREARDKVMQSDPSFPTQSSKLSDQMHAYEADLDAAMIKAQPDMAPLVEKYKANRHVETAQAH